MLAAATSLFSRSSLNTNYTIQGASNPIGSAFAAIPSPAFGASQAQPASTLNDTPPFSIGLWKILRAENKSSRKAVSVWMFEKKALDSMKPASREIVLEALRKEAGSLSRLRHPCILEMVEPMEETRSDITFATELIMSSLSGALGSARAGGVLDGVDLDEVEIQKGILQVTHGLSFLHNQAKLVHQNLSPEAILINSKGDWKLGSLSMTTSLVADGTSGPRWTFPEYDNRLPESVQRRWDFLAPEYALDEEVSASSDLYALGCVIYAVHLGGRPPFQNHNSLSTLRQNADRLARGDIGSSSAMAKLGTDLRDLLAHLVTRRASTRLTALTLPSHPFFSNLAISTLLFLDRSTFSSKPKEEKATFLRGLLRVLPKFSERLRKRKILPSLLEEMKDPWLLPFLLPNVFDIAKTQTKEEFNSATLPALQPLFALTDPPQNMLTLLDSMPLFVEKTTPSIFREHIMQLVYHSLESDHPEVQEKGLRTIPSLLNVLDVGTVQEILFVKVAILFTKTRILSVKVVALETFREMVPTLDKVSLTQKLVPLLAKIKTKEPDVMMATLGVHEAMGAKVDREAVATLVLPQLWGFAIGPLLSVEQFSRFTATIDALGARVKQEHAQQLRENERIRNQTASYTAAAQAGPSSGPAGEVDFESLVSGRGQNGAGAKVISEDPWGEDPWDSVIPSSAQSATSAYTSPPTSTPYSPPTAPVSTPSYARGTSSHGQLNGRPLPASAFNSSAFTTNSPSSASSPAVAPPQPRVQTYPSFAPPPTTARPAAPPAQPSLSSFQPMAPSSLSRTPSSAAPPSANYNVSIPSQRPSSSLPSLATQTSSFPSMAPMAPALPAARPMPPGYSSGVLQPTSTARPGGQWGSQAAKKAAVDEFDPFG